MGTQSHGRLYRLAKRLSIGRLLCYLALWARYAWRRGQSALFIRLSRRPVTDIAAQAAVLADSDLATAKRMAVASWFPRDLANVRLHRALPASVAEARPDLGVTPEILDCISRLKNADDLSASVDAMVENYFPQNYATAESGMFVGLEPLSDLEAKTARVLAALAQARRAELKGGGDIRPAPSPCS